ncbi:MAG TPA: RcnB family protein [Sphingomicrobium sp.]|jgi:Ni/Co efflux regulator RcnB
MRKVLISLLLAGAAATPAIAGPHNWSDRSSASEERQSARQERDSAREDRKSAREERQSSREERKDSSPKVDVRANVNAPAHVQAVGRADQRDVNAIRSARQDARQDRSNFAAQNGGNYVAPGPRVVDQRFESLRERQVQARDQRIQERDLRQSSRPTPAVMRTHPPAVSTVPRAGTQPPLRTDSRHGGNHHWDTNWRHNGHYDWQNYRHHHRSIFHLGFYYDPYGWGYEPFSIGWRLWPSYYGRNYWISDPWYYHLPYAPAGYVWVRYWNDALLVDTWSGTVVDVIPGFFW